MTAIMIKFIWAWICSNPETTVFILLGIAEAITRLTPTKKDDGFVMRAGQAVKWFFDIIKVPNRLKKGPGIKLD